MRDALICLWTVRRLCCGNARYVVADGKRGMFKNCPSCDPHKTRKSKVTPTFVAPKKDEVDGLCQVCYANDVLLKGCDYCGYRACGECVKGSALAGEFTAKCMNAECAQQHSLGWLVDAVGMEWVRGEYTTFYRTKLYEREKGMLPTAMPFVPLYKRLLELGEDIADLTIIRCELANMFADGKEENLIYNEILELGSWSVDKPTKTTNKIYLQGCPVGECRGFIEKDGGCVVCGGKLCVECRREMKEGHVCNEDDVSTIKAMQGNTKPCPKCAAPVYKVSGCDQMWCVVCHTAFGWNTQRIEEGTIHNPHYYEWAVEQGIRGAQRDFVADSINEKMFAIIARILIQADGYGYDQSNIPYALFGLNHVRVMYVMGMLTEDEWKKKISEWSGRLRYYNTLVGAHKRLTKSLESIVAPYYDLTIETDPKVVKQVCSNIIKRAEVVRCAFNYEMKYHNPHLPYVRHLDHEWYPSGNY